MLTKQNEWFMFQFPRRVNLRSRQIGLELHLKSTFHSNPNFGKVEFVVQDSLQAMLSPSPLVKARVTFWWIAWKFYLILRQWIIYSLHQLASSVPMNFFPTGLLLFQSCLSIFVEQLLRRLKVVLKRLILTLNLRSLQMITHFDARMIRPGQRCLGVNLFRKFFLCWSFQK